MKEKKKRLEQSPEKKKQEHLTRKDLEELMGVNRPTYGRNKHGAISTKRN